MSEQQSLFGKKLHADLEIEDELWEAAEDLRGTVAPADYKHYVLPLLFLRYLSLRYEERRDELEAMSTIRSPITSRMTSTTRMSTEARGRSTYRRRPAGATWWSTPRRTTSR